MNKREHKIYMRNWRKAHRGYGKEWQRLNRKVKVLGVRVHFRLIELLLNPTEVKP